jgi:deazaflavin-dependent oxidoreductase (nitroreductase family)
MSHDAAIRAALAHGHTIDITTTGRRSGQLRRKEIVFHVIEGRLYISGTPRPRQRDWLRILEADPHLTFHLKETVQADLPATARVIGDEEERRTLLAEIARIWRRDDLAAMIRESPLIEVTIDALTL